MQYSIVQYSEVKKNLGFRIDGEYWHPLFIKNASLVSGERKILSFIDSDVPNIKSLPRDTDFEYLEISNISDWSHKTLHINKGEEPSRAHYILKEKDVAVSTVRPNRNAVAFITKNDIIGSSGLSVLRAQGVEPEYLFIFCKTRYFINCLVRATKATMYPAVSNSDVINTPILIPTLSFRREIKKNVNEAFSILRLVKKKYQWVQDFFLSELKLENWYPKQQLFFIKRYLDLKKAQRGDAEYYKPKYEELIDIIKRYSSTWDKLGNIVTMKKCTEVGSENYLDTGVAFVRVSNLSLFEVTEEKYISEDLYEKIQEHQPKKGEILLTKDATPGIAYHLRERPKKMIPSSGILRLKPDSEKVNTDYLTFVLNSLVVKEQIDRDAGGSVILHWRPEQIEQTIIPIFRREKQIQIQRKIQEAFELYNQSKYLLQCAKKAVEIAIEKNEKAAMNWMRKSVRKSGDFQI